MQAESQAAFRPGSPLKGGQSRLGGGSPRKLGESATQLDSRSVATGTERGGSPAKSMYPGSCMERSQELQAREEVVVWQALSLPLARVSLEARRTLVA